MAAAGKYSSWVHSGFFGILQKISVPVSSILITMILAHKAISREEMGVWALFMSITAVIELIRQGLVKTSLIKFINHSSHDEHKYVLSAALFLNAAITLITALVLFFCARYFAVLLKAPQLENMIYLLQAGMLIMIPFSHFEWVMYGNTQMKGLFWAYLFRQGITLLLVAVIVIFTGKISLNMLVVIYNIAMLTGTIILYKYVRKFLSHTFILSKEWVLRLLHFGKYVFGSGLSTLVFRSADQFMISPLLGSTAITASQNVSVRIINLADIPSQVLGDILFPRSAKKENSERKETIKYYYEKAVGATLCIIIPFLLIFVLFPKLIILILAGPQYLDAIPYLRLISITGIFLAFLKQFGVIMDSTGNPKINLIAITILAVIHVFFCYFFIKHFGLLGAAYALLSSHVTGFILTQLLLYKFFRINFLNCFKNAFLFYPEFANIIFEKLNLKWKTR